MALCFHGGYIHHCLLPSESKYVFPFSSPCRSFNNKISISVKNSVSILRASIRPSFPNTRILNPLSSLPRSAMAQPYAHELQLAMKAVSLASRLCQAVQTMLLSNETHLKADKSPVTVADYGSQALVSLVLERGLLPDSFSLVAEEDAEDLRREEGAEMLARITELVNETIATDAIYDDLPLSKEDILAAIDRGKSDGGSIGRHWVLDPIDGTKGFLRGDQYAIALALLEDGEVVLGVLACPNLPMVSVYNENLAGDPVGCLFCASQGAGTMVQSLDGLMKPKRVYVSSTSNPAEAIFCESFESAHSMQDLTKNIANILGIKLPPVRIDSQAKYGAMARGDASIYLRFPHPGYREKIWDHAAGAIVIEEAGGVVLDAAGKALDFSKGRFLDLEYGIVATNPELMPAVLQAVKTAVKKGQSSNRVESLM